MEFDYYGACYLRAGPVAYVTGGHTTTTAKKTSRKPFHMTFAPSRRELRVAA